MERIQTELPDQKMLWAGLSSSGIQARERLHHATKLARESLASSQVSMKERFDRRAVKRQFQPGDEVLVLLPRLGSALTARFSGLFVVESKV